jgi:hypothetical protein
MPIGRDQAHGIRLQHEQRPVQEVPRVLSGNGKLRFRHHFPETRSRHRGDLGAGGFGQRGEVFARQRLHAGIEAVGRDFHRALLFSDPHVGLGQRLDDLVELLGRQRERAALGHRRSALAAQTNFEISREKLDLLPLRLDQHVGENGNRVLALDDSLEKLQFSQKVVLPDD